MNEKASISTIFSQGFENFKKNSKTVVPLFVGLEALVFLLANSFNTPILNLLMIPVVLFMQIALFKSYKNPISKFDINEVLSLKDPNLKTNLWKLFISYVIYIVLAILMAITIIGIPFAIFFLIYWYVFPYVVLDQGLSGWSALKKSKEIIKGNWWKTFAIFLISVILSLIVSSIVGQFTLESPLISGFIMSVISALISIYFGYVGLTYYFSLKK